MDRDNANTTLLQENLLKITETQNKIRNKFKKACENRLENEHAVNQTMEPLTTFATSTTAAGETRGEEEKSTLPSQPQIIEKTIHSTSNKKMKTSRAKMNKKNEDEKINPKVLCARLSTLITDEIRNNANHKREKNSIIKKLRDMKIIV